MIEMRVDWINATRPPEFRRMVELTYRDILLEVFHDAATAKKARDYYASHPKTPFQDWPRENHYAYRQVIRNLTPNESVRAQFRVSFDER